MTLPLVRELGVDPVLGQWFHDESGVVLSSALWRQLGSDPAIVGKPLTMDGRSYTITGVMPERSPAGGGNRVNRSPTPTSGSRSARRMSEPPTSCMRGGGRAFRLPPRKRT